MRFFTVWPAVQKEENKASPQPSAVGELWENTIVKMMYNLMTDKKVAAVLLRAPDFGLPTYY